MEPIRSADPLELAAEILSSAGGEGEQLALQAEQRLHEQACAFLRASKAPSTLRAYRSDWAHFVTWCEGRGALALPANPKTVALYLVPWPRPTGLPPSRAG